MIRATFSGERNTINFDLPKGWHELSQSELCMVMRCKARQEEPHQAKFAVLLHLTGLKVLRREGEMWVCSVPTGEKNPKRFLLDPELLPGLLDGLNWMDDPGDVPVRLDTLHGTEALPVRLHGESTEKVLFFKDQNEKCLRFITFLSTNRLNKAMIGRKRRVKRLFLRY